MKKLLFTCTLLFCLGTYAKSHNPTWTDGIACIIYSHCTSCHNPNGIANFPLVTYDDVYENRYSIAASVQAKSMPPFPPSQVHQRYAHANTLSDHEIDEIRDWVNNFAPLGNASQIPTPPTYATSYQLTDADLVLQIPNYTVNTTNDLYRCFVLPLNNATELSIKKIEIVPGNRQIVHHALVFQDTSQIPVQLDNADPGPGYTAFGGTGSQSSRLVWGYTPGQGMQEFAPGFAVNVRANSRLIIQIHYPGGVSNTVDYTQIRIKYGTGNLRNIFTIPILNHLTTLTNGPLAIPPNEVKTFYTSFTVNQNATVFGLLPHMHLLGKSIKSFFIKPNGDTTILVDIPEWDFHWQSFYQFQKPLLVPAGSVLHGVATYDNTINNPNNPNNPPKLVTQGEGTDDEMFLIYFSVTDFVPSDTSIIIDTSSHFAHHQVCNPASSTTYFNPQKIEIYPNPVHQQFTITGLPSPAKYSVYASHGQLVQQGTYTGEPIDANNWQTGAHYLKFEFDDQVIYKKVLKE